MEPIRFIRDDRLEKEKEILEEVVDVVKRDVKINKDVYVGKRFIKALILASRTIQGDKYILKQSVISPELLEHIIETSKLKSRIKKEISKKEEKKIVKEKEKVIEKEYKHELRDLLVRDNKILASAYLERENGELKYILLEPDVNQIILETLKKEIREEIEKDGEKVNDDNFLKQKLKKIYKKIKIEYQDRDLINLKYYLYRDLVKYGKIDPLFYDDKVGAIIFEDNIVKVEFGKDKINTNIKLEKEDIEELFEKFSKISGKKLSEKDPILTGNIKGFKMHATYSKTNPRFVFER